MDCCDICTSGGGEGGSVMRTLLRGGFSGLIRVGGEVMVVRDEFDCAYYEQ